MHRRTRPGVLLALQRKWRDIDITTDLENYVGINHTHMYLGSTQSRDATHKGTPC